MLLCRGQTLGHSHKQDRHWDKRNGKGLANPRIARHGHGSSALRHFVTFLPVVYLLSWEGWRTCLIGEGLARGVQSRFGYTPTNIFLFFRSCGFLGRKGGILAVMDLRHGAAEAQTPLPRGN